MHISFIIHTLVVQQFKIEIMQYEYPDYINKFIEGCFDKIIKPTILPTPLKWQLTEGEEKLLQNGQILLDKNPFPLALMSYKGQCFEMSFSYGLILSMAEIINLSYQVGFFDSLLNEKKESLLVNNDQYGNNTFLMDYSYLTNDYNDTNYLCVDFPNTENGMSLCSLLLDYSLAFICLHERSHIFRGHWDYLDSKKTNIIFEAVCESKIIKLQKEFKPTDLVLAFTGEQIERQAIEMDADYWALVELISRNTQESYNWVYTLPFIKEKKDVIYLTCFAISLVFLLFKRYQFKNAIFNPHSPDPSLRLLQIRNSILNFDCLDDTEMVNGEAGVMDALHLSDYLYSAYNGLINSSKIFRYNGDNDENNIWGENAMSIYSTIKTSQINIKQRLKEYEKRWS